MSECPYDKAAKTVDCGNPYQHWEKKRLIDAVLYLHKRLDSFGALAESAEAVIASREPHAYPPVVHVGYTPLEKLQSALASLRKGE